MDIITREAKADFIHFPLRSVSISTTNAIRRYEALQRRTYLSPYLLSGDRYTNLKSPTFGERAKPTDYDSISHSNLFPLISKNAISFGVQLGNLEALESGMQYSQYSN